MYHEVIGEYSHDLFDSWGHEVTAEAIAHGNTSIPAAYDYECSEDSKPPSSNLN